ncbi:glycosyltransferase family 4 protein [Flavobacteriales bacterium]|nr:glycosyltransferase family 4 protein [Flavobacteriales bacterium]
MKILQICNKPPYPAVDGGAIAMNNTTQGLISNGYEVKVLAISTAKHPVNIDSLPEDYLVHTKFESVFIDTSIKLKNAFFNLFSSKSYNIERFISKDLTKKLIAILEKENFDVIILESLFVAPYIESIKKISKAKIVLRAHNVEYKIWERISLNTKNPIKKSYLSLLAKRLKAYEIKTFKDLDGIVAMTKVDADQFVQLGFNKGITSVPTGYIINQTDCENVEVEKNSIFHIASMDWLPNVEGINWFLNKVWKTVHLNAPNSKLYLAGREMPKEFYNLKLDNVITVGKVESAKEFYLSKKIMIVPVLSGSGMRIKIIEGMALGKVIISTTIGAEGIQVTNNKNILIADSPEEFSEAIIKCTSDENFCNEIGLNAQKLIVEKYSNSNLSNQLISFFNLIQEN